jgi:hypothetical protein
VRRPPAATAAADAIDAVVDRGATPPAADVAAARRCGAPAGAPLRRATTACGRCHGDRRRRRADAQRLAPRVLPTVVNTKPRQPLTRSTATTAYYEETKWCGACDREVRFLMSVNHSFCIHCGGTVTMFRREAGSAFGERVQRHRRQAS